MAGQTETAYPSQYETNIVLKDGSSILVRPIKRNDAQAWTDFVSRLSPRTRYLRFQHAISDPASPEDAVRFCSVDYHDTFAFVAEVRREPKRDIVAIARYYRLPEGRSAEVAIVIEDDYQGRGLGTGLLERLADVARQNGIDSFEADVTAENSQMMNVFKDYGFHVVSELQAGEYHVTVGGGHRGLPAPRHHRLSPAPVPDRGRLLREDIPGKPQYRFADVAQELSLGG
jgi:RimJ/RimL family protein N-acetyltransferase